MKYSEIKTVKSFCADLFSTTDWREIVGCLENEADDFTVDNVRFIAADSIDEIQQEELSNDEYMLGCFNDGFIADILGIDVDVIQAMQKADAFEAIGKLIISLDKLEELQAEYARQDGYGHHFNGYDGGEEEITINGRDYFVFDNR